MYSEVKTNKLGYILNWFDKEIGTDYEVDEHDELVTVVTWFDLTRSEADKLDKYLSDRDYYLAID